MGSPLDCFGEPLHLLEMICLSVSSIVVIACKGRISERREERKLNGLVYNAAVHCPIPMSSLRLH